MPRYLYGMRHLRGFGPGCQPGKGLISREDDPAGKYNDVLVYDRELEPHELDSYELDFIGAEPDTTTDGSNVVKKGGNDEDRTTDDLVSRQAVKNIFTELYGISAIGSVFDRYEWADICETTANELPPVQPERKDTLEKAVAVEAISDELMSRFDISATYAYEIAEKAMNRIEAMAKEIGKR